MNIRCSANEREIQLLLAARANGLRCFCPLHNGLRYASRNAAAKEGGTGAAEGAVRRAEEAAHRFSELALILLR